MMADIAMDMKDDDNSMALSVRIRRVFDAEDGVASAPMANGMGCSLSGCGAEQWSANGCFVVDSEFGMIHSISPKLDDSLLEEASGSLDG